MKYDIDFKYFPQKTEIPTSAVEKGMNVLYYGVLYYIMAGYDDTALVASLLEIEEKKVVEGFNYFSDKGIITLSNPRTPEKVVEEDKKQEKKGEKKKYVLKLYPKDVKNIVAENFDLKMLMDNLQMTLGRPIKDSEMVGYIDIYENCQMTPEAIILMVGYFKELGKTSMAYISKVAYDWAYQNITSYKQVEEKIQEMEKNRSFEQTVIRIFAIKANKLSENQSKMCENWLKMGIDNEQVLEYAYNCCMDGTGKSFSWSYVNKVITNWAENGAFTLEKAKEAQEKHKEEQEKKYNKISGNKNKKKFKYSGAFDTAEDFGDYDGEFKSGSHFEDEWTDEDYDIFED